MCNVIKLQSSKGKPSIKVTDEFDDYYFETESEEETINKRIQAEYNKGVEDGIRSTEEKLRRELENQLQLEKRKFDDVLLTIENELLSYEEKFADMVVSLSIAVSKKIINREIELESPIIENIKAVAQKLIGAGYLVIKSHPDEISVVKEYSNKIFSEGNFSKIKFEEDERIEKGGFLIESDIGNIDGQVTSQLEEVKKSITNLKFN